MVYFTELRGAEVVANEVEKFRARQKLSRAELASRLGISRQSLHSIEAGEQVPKVYLALALARLLGCRVEELFPREQTERLFVDGDGPEGGSFRACISDVGGKHVIRRSTAVGFGSATAPSDAVVRLGDSGYEIDSETGTSRLFIDGCDPVLGLVSNRVSERQNFKVRWFYGSNRTSIEKLNSGLTHCALVHGIDPGLLRRAEQSEERKRVGLGEWIVAICFPLGNPKGIFSVRDIARPDVTLAFREQGSGVRHFIQEEFNRLGLDHQKLDESFAFSDHYRVAAAVALGVCDVGVVPLSVAQDIGLGYCEVGTHSSQLLFSDEGYEVALTGGFFDVLTSATFAKEVAVLGGYRLVG